MSELTTHEKLDLILEKQARIEERLDRSDETMDWIKERIYDLENDFNDGYSIENTGVYEEED